MNIPKIIHQSYKTSNLPKEISENIENIKTLHPDWEYRFYDDNDINNFILKTYGLKMINLYNKINPKYGSARADFFRYLLIYKEGGVWLDVKSSIKDSLNNSIKKTDYFLLSQWQNKINEPYEGWGLHIPLYNISGGEFQQWHIISNPNNLFLKAVINKVLFNINNYTPKIFGVGANGVFMTTGPIAYTLAIYPLLKKYKNNYRFVDSIKDLNLEYSIYNSLENPNKVQHRQIFNNHYTILEEPIII